jgi:hypothetical protein
MFAGTWYSTSQSVAPASVLARTDRTTMSDVTPAELWMHPPVMGPLATAVMVPLSFAERAV